ncbi:MAG: hypothetical protein ACLP7J_07260 [Streptosporangiaceae bacterium]
MARHKHPLAGRAPYRELSLALADLRRRAGLAYRRMAVLIDEP